VGGVYHIYIGKDGTRFVHSYFFLKGLGFLGVSHFLQNFSYIPTVSLNILVEKPKYCISGVMVSMLASSGIDREFEPRSG
jgi:hypothetical protein